MKEKTKKLIKTVKVLVKVGKFAATAATVAMAVYTLIPKYEKIEGVDTDALIAQTAQEK
ncbi:MAG: hypothetical protein IKJ27_01480 [Clostridia bacterium]|nr:hypothetical protein [Clostridia bacterium]